MTNPNAAVAEIVVCKLNEDANEADFLNAIKASEGYISGSAGFISRQLSKDEDGTWTDYTLWASMDDAMAAANGFMSQSFAAAILQGIDQDSFSMRHQTVLWPPEPAKDTA